MLRLRHTLLSKQWSIHVYHFVIFPNEYKLATHTFHDKYLKLDKWANFNEGVLTVGKFMKDDGIVPCLAFYVREKCNDVE